MIECPYLTGSRSKFIVAQDMEEVFEINSTHDIIEYLQEIDVYPYI